VSQTILTTKLYVPPPQPRLVLRPHLIMQLNEGLHRKLALISAPAGFGKTTVLSDWVAGCQRPVAWLSLDEGDSDPTRFLSHLIAALQTISPDMGQGVSAALRSPQPPSIESILTALINEITAVPEKFVLVLDDYHVIDAKSIDDALAFLLEHLPPQMHLVIATREDPHLPLARLRVRGQLTELRATDLRFTPSEAAEFLNQSMGLNLSAEDIAALETRTEGWIAGLQLAALSIRGREDVPEFIQAFAGDDRYVVDYLVEEVLQRQSGHVRQFLLETSILERLSGSLCGAVTGREDGKALLETLERDNLFVIPLDGKRHWFRYHQLFADVLQMRASAEQPGQLPVWHRRASEWYEQSGLPSEAIRHALRSGDFERSAALVERVAHEMLMSRHEETFLGWLAELPRELVRKRPVLSTYYALALVSFDLEAADAPLRDAERFLEASADVEERSQALSQDFVIVDETRLRSLPGIICIIRAYQSGARGDVAGIVEYAQRALDRLSEDEYVWRGAAASLLGLAHWTNGNLEAAYRSFVEGIALLRMSGDVTQSFSGSFIAANIRTAQGRLRDAERTYEEALKLVSEQGEPLSPPAVDLHVGMSELHREYNDLERANRYLLRMRELSPHGGISEYRHDWYIAMALIKSAEGDLDHSLDLLEEAERLFLPSPDPVIRPISALKARVWIRQGRLSDAQDWSRQQSLSLEDDLSYLREFEHITLARLLIAQYRSSGTERYVRDALDFLQRLRTAAEEGGRTGSLIEILVLEALTFEARGEISQALSPVERALTLAEPEGYVRIFVDEGQQMARILSAAVDREIAPDYAGNLLSAFEGGCMTGKDKPQSTPAEPVQALVDPLSGRELEVLRLVAQGLSNREISERLFVALNTVKGHNRVIFSKLQVQRRTEAIARARELGLL
jgi:LuxR family transcriptional regulator, maltose regulon positive regulatory protein